MFGFHNGTIRIGFEGEQNAREIAIPLIDRTKWPEAFVSLLVLRPGDAQPYFAANVTEDTAADALIWTPDGYDMQKAGYGSAVVIYTDEADGKTVVGKSSAYSVLIGDSIHDTGEAEIPDPYESWVAAVTASALQAREYAAAAQTAQTVAESAQTAAVEQALKSEGFAVGKQSGTEVGSGSPYYENNAKYYAEQAQEALESIPQDYSELSEDVSELKTSVYTKTESDAIFVSLLTKDNYRQVRNAWFNANGCAVMTDLTDLCERWYRISRLGWKGGTRFSNPAQSTSSTGTKVGNNAGLVCEPSTNAAAGRDDYAGLPLFAVMDCNWSLDANGKRHITAIEGIISGNAFEKGNWQRPVGVLQMAPWLKYENSEQGYTEWMTDQEQATGFYPAPEAVDLDGTVHSFVLHSKYGFGDDYSSISGVPIRVWDVSHNSQITAVRNKFNDLYCGRTSADDAWMKLMTHIKYASLTLDGIMNGCCLYYNNNKKIAYAETGVKRIIVTADDGAGLVVGSTICVGTSSYGSKAAQCSVVDRKRITSIEEVEIGGTTYAAVNLDVDTAFNTTTDLYWTTMQWYTGSTDDVQGNDGSPFSNTSNKEPYKLQGIEQSYGCFEVIADVILNYEADGDDTNLCLYVCRSSANLATSITANYKKVGYSALCTKTADGWDYIKRLGFDPSYPEVWFGQELGGSSSTYTKDGLYIKKAGTTGAYEWRALGGMNGGLTVTGLSCTSADARLPDANWNIGGRLSPNGSRGEFAA